MNINQKYRGILYVLLAAFFFSLMTLFLKLAGDISSFEKSFFRNFVALIFALGVIIKNKITFRINNPGDLGLLVLRSTGGTLGIVCNFYAVDHLVIADANMLNKLSPFFAIIFSFFLLKEKVAPYQIGCILIAFFGALCIIKPGMSSLASFPALIGAIGGLGAGFAYTCVRMLSQRGVPGPIIVFFFSTFSCPVSIPPSIPVFVMPTAQQLAFLLLTGLAAAGGQFSITAAYACAPAREISVFDYSQILFAAFLGILFLGEYPDGLSIVGYLLITGAGIMMFLRKRREN